MDIMTKTHIPDSSKIKKEITKLHALDDHYHYLMLQLLLMEFLYQLCII